ncbi:hypothetical protein Tsubulata_007971 [Turnera subulata]|uniref:Zinc knuckle CX2CX4HX4C domain-containing protein n=1 Tax=Turnera subulata TaxID=218843 RepID=A0A9Q0G5F0_9ROSI|nr:hypothetical protein Tsubulata_007971 [Turnera subulata]
MVGKILGDRRPHISQIQEPNDECLVHQGRLLNYPEAKQRLPLWNRVRRGQEEGTEGLTMACLQYAPMLKRLVPGYDLEPEAMLGWQGFIRARVEIDTGKPLLPGVACIDSNGKEFWIRFQYERLGELCCGLITHPTNRCLKPPRPDEGIERKAEDSFGPWMRAKEIFGKHYPARKQVPVEQQKEMGGSGPNLVQTNTLLDDITDDRSHGTTTLAGKKRKVLEEVLQSPIKEVARRDHTGLMNMVAELVTELHDSSPIKASASKPSWKRMARKTKVDYQPTTCELIQAFEMEEEGRSLDGGVGQPTGVILTPRLASPNEGK